MMVLVVVMVVVVVMTVARALVWQFQDDREQQGQANVPQAFLGYRHNGERRDVVGSLRACFRRRRSMHTTTRAQTGQSTRTDVTRCHNHHCGTPGSVVVGDRDARK